MKNQNKTVPTTITADEFLSHLEDQQKFNDSQQLIKLFEEVTGQKPKMWGPSIIGFGSYHYKYESGREGDSCITGFSPRKDSLVLYILPGYLDIQDKLGRLGKHKIGKACLYIKSLSDVDLKVLKEIVQYGVDYIRKNYEVL